MAQSESKPQWESFSANLFKAKAIGGDKGAMGVDRVTGQLFVDCGAGVWMSTDQGKTFTRVDFELPPGPGAAICSRGGWSLPAIRCVACQMIFENPRTAKFECPKCHRQYESVE